MKKILFSVLLGVAFLSGCSPDAPSESGNGIQLTAKEFTVTSDPDCGAWNEGDSIAVVDALGSHVFVAQSSGSEVLFSGEASASSTRRYAVSPVSSFVSYDKINLTVCVPSVQREYTPLYVSVTSGDRFEMKQASAAVSFSVTSKDIREIRLEGSGLESIAGPAMASFLGSSGEPSLAPAGDGSVIKVLPKNGNTYIEPGTVRISCLPVSLKSGLDLAFFMSDGSTRTVALHDPVSADSGETIELGEVERQTESKVIELSFFNGSFVWPFESPQASQLSSSMTLGLGSFQKQEVELKLPESLGGYVFKVYGTNGMAKHSAQGFRFGGGSGDYMDLPAVDGMYLSEITLVSGSTTTSLVACPSLGGSVLGGQAESFFGAAGDSFSWTLYGSQRSASYRLSSTGTGTVSIRSLRLRYDSCPPEIPTGGVKIAEEIASAKTGEERYEALYRAHIKALAMGVDPDYSGAGTIELTVPASPRTIPLGRNNDFKGTVFKVRDNVGDLYLFSMKNNSSRVDVTGKNIDSADYSSVPELRSGLYVLRIQDDSLWVANREGYDYGATRRDAVLVRDGKGSCEPCASYDTPATRINCTYCAVDDELKTFTDVSLIRDPLSSAKVSLLNVSYQNNLKISKVFVQTPQDNDWYGDHTINILYSTNVLCEDITFDGTYSQTDHFGYGLACNCLWNATFRRITSHSRWGVFGCNNLHDSTLEESDCERFDTHCYGKNITVRNSTITGRGIPVASIYGTILIENCKFVNCYFYSTRTDYNSYVPFDIVIRNSEITPKGTSLISMGRLNTVTNSRPELAKKNWPNVTIENLTVNVPSGYTAMYLFSSQANNLKKPLGYISRVSIDGLKFNYVSGAPSLNFYLSQYKIQTESRFTLGIKGMKLASPSGVAPANLYINIEGNPLSYSVDAESDVKVNE